jgi:NAD(P)-dependent dehydrogenase (short-subunit alcohol dehydrogenase family)
VIPGKGAPGQRIVLITGASRGIGAETARLCAARGAAVAINYRVNQAAADAVVTGIANAGGHAIAIQADVSIEADVVRMFQTIDERLGRVTALVNNAGIIDRQTRLEQMDAARIARVLATNVIGAFVCAREAVRRMSIAHGGSGGAIVNVSSMAARLGSPGEYVDYAASKGALDTMTVGLAREVAREGIRVNAVRAGIINTDIHASGGEPARVARLGPQQPMGRGGEAIEVARAIVWLLSEEASYTTGSFIDVAGGR